MRNKRLAFHCHHHQNNNTNNKKKKKQEGLSLWTLLPLQLHEQTVSGRRNTKNKADRYSGRKSSQTMPMPYSMCYEESGSYVKNGHPFVG